MKEFKHKSIEKLYKVNLRLFFGRDDKNQIINQIFNKKACILWKFCPHKIEEPSLEAIRNFETLNKLSFFVDKKLMALNRRIEKEAKEIQLKYNDFLMKKQKIENEKKEHERRLKYILHLFYPRLF